MRGGPGHSLRPWALRVASRPEAGGGHVHRCIALASALAGHVPVVFVLDRGGESWQDRLRAMGFAAEVEGESPVPTPCAVLDGYRFDAAAILRWRRDAECLAIIDDHGAAQPEADLVVQVAAPRSSLRAGQTTLAGLSYALIDPALATLSRAPVGRRCEHLLMSFGVRDSVNATGFAVRAIFALPAGERPHSLTVVLGSGAPHLAEVSASVEMLGAHGRVEVDVTDMQRVYASVDCAVGAGGVGLLERAAAGIPSLTVVTADNQRTAVAMVAAGGGTQSLGGIAELSEETFATTLRSFLADVDLRTSLARRARACVDGRGAERVANALLGLAQQVRAQ